MANEDLFKLFEVDPDARMEVIEAAYRALSQAYHPDKPGNEGNLQQRLNDGIEILRDPKKRRQAIRDNKERSQLNRDNKELSDLKKCNAVLKKLFNESLKDLRGLLRLWAEYQKDARAITMLWKQGHGLANGTVFSEEMADRAMEVRYADYKEDLGQYAPATVPLDGTPFSESVMLSAMNTRLRKFTEDVKNVTSGR
jgi:curved DNA-binding protein CbpA